MDNAIEIKNTNNELAMPVEFIDVAGFDDLGAEDFSLPRLVLVQLQHVHEGAENHHGWYYRTDTNEHVESPELLIIGIAKSRAMFDDGFSRDAEPLCRSDDGFYPRQDFIGTGVKGYQIPGNCASCKFSEWNEDNPPACSLADNWAALTNEGEPVIFRMKGSGAKVSKQLKNVIRVARARKRPSYIKLGSAKEVGDNGVFYVPTFQIIRDAPPEDMLYMAKELAGINLASRAAEVADLDRTIEREAVIREYSTPYDDAPFPGDEDYPGEPEGDDIPF